MKAPPAATDVERRKKVKIRIRRDLAIAPQKYEGRTYYVVKDPVSLRYYRFKEQEHFLIRMMDGAVTLDDAQKAYEKRFRPERLTLEDLEQFAQQLLTAGLAHNESPQAGKQLFDRRKKRRRSEWMQTFTNILYIKIPVYDPDKVLTWMLPYLRWIFTFWFMALSVGTMLAAILLVLTHWTTFYERLPYFHQFFSFKNVVYMWIALGAVKVIHEFGHGLSCKAYGGEVHEMGLLFLVLSPCLYCNVSDAWTLPNKWKRIIISFAGIYVELIIAAIATFIWWNTPSSPGINNTCLNLMVVCSVSTIIFNANPLMRYDGYYILADFLEIPNLRDRSNRFLQRLIMEHCMGVELHPEPYMALWRRVMFVLYAIISWVYRWVITFSILYFMSRFLEPYRLKVVSQMLAIGAGVSLLGWPLFRLIKNIHKRGRLPDMNSVRVTISSIAVAAVILFIFLVPLPVSRVRVLGLVQVKPEKVQKAVVMIPGVLERICVRDGDQVREGQPLAQFRSLDLESELLEDRTQRDVNDHQYTVLSQLIVQPSSDPERRGQLAVETERVKGERDRYAALVEVLEQQMKELQLKAPCDGVVMSPPHADESGRYGEEIGKFYDKQPFCSIGDPQQLRVLLPLSPADYRLLKRDYEETRKQGGELSVTIRVQGRADLTWHGRISENGMPESEAKDVPIQLTNSAGNVGPVAVKPPNPQQPNVHVPQAQQYLVSVDILDPDAAISPGTMAYVKINCRWRSTAWWAWRWFSSAFDLGMDWTDIIPRPLRPRE
jgi:putative peptide zinc metalloprotease protein